MVRKDAVSSSQVSSDSTDLSGARQAPVPDQHHPHQVAQQQSFPAVAPSTVINIAAHSLLMITVPFALFLASHFGGFDTLFELTVGQVPSKATKTYLGAGLAVLGVNLVIISFVVSAFREQPVEASKKED